MEEAGAVRDLPANGVRQINVDWDVPAVTLKQFAYSDALEEGAARQDNEAPHDALTVCSGDELSMQYPNALLDVADVVKHEIRDGNRSMLYRIRAVRGKHSGI